MRIADPIRGVAAVLALTAVGCTDSLTEENALLREENQELRERLSTQSGGAASTTAATPGVGVTDLPVGEQRTYVVKRGDTLSGISRAMYGTAAQWRTIYDANRAAIGEDYNRLKVGMELVIPPVPATP